MIRTLIFDMGQVLLRFDRDVFLARLEVSDADKALLKREVFLSLEWARMDRGSMTEEETVKSMCSRLPIHLWAAVEELVCRWDQPILPMEGMYELVAELKQEGYGIYLLSNASCRQHAYWPNLPVSRFFDGTLISADEKLVKPQPEIYRLLLERFSLNAEECLFVDDSPANIEGAYLCGIRGIVFHGDASLLRRELRAAGVRLSGSESG